MTVIYIYYIFVIFQRNITRKETPYVHNCTGEWSSTNYTDIIPKDWEYSLKVLSISLHISIGINNVLINQVENVVTIDILICRYVKGSVFILWSPWTAVVFTRTIWIILIGKEIISLVTWLHTVSWIIKNIKNVNVSWPFCIK